MKIKITDIRTDGDTQSRYLKLDGTTVYDYADDMKTGAKFPSVTVFHDGESYWLADGFHRLAAAQRIGWDEIEADVQQGTQRDARLFSAGANSNHGLRRSRQDKRRAVEILLRDPEWSQWSDREIARRAGVSAPMVGAVREELKATVKHLQSGVRKTADGRVMDTTNIGKEARHWGLSNGTPFWSLVEKAGLDKSTILDKLQSGATHLTDLEMTKEEAWQKIKDLAAAALAELYRLDSHVLHVATGRVGRAMGWHMGIVNIADIKNDSHETWMADGLRRAGQTDIDAYLRPEKPEKTPAEKFGFAVGDYVRVVSRGSFGTVQHVYPNGYAAVKALDSIRTESFRVDDLERTVPPTEQLVNEPRFEVGQSVVIAGSDVVGTVTELKQPGLVRVTRPNPNSEGVNMTHWVNEDKVSPVPSLKSHSEDEPTDELAEVEDLRFPVLPWRVKSEPDSVVLDRDGAPVCKFFWREGTRLGSVAQYVADLVNMPSSAYINRHDQPELAEALHNLGLYKSGEAAIYGGILRDLDLLEGWLDDIRSLASAEINQPEEVNA